MKKAKFKHYILNKEEEIDNNLVRTQISLEETYNMINEIQSYRDTNKVYSVINNYSIHFGDDTIGYIINFLGGILDDPSSLVDINTFVERDNDRENYEVERKSFYMILLKDNYDDNVLNILCESRNNIITFPSIVKFINKCQGYDGDKYSLEIELAGDINEVINDARRIIEYTEIYDVHGQGEVIVSEGNMHAKSKEITYRSGRNNNLNKNVVLDKIQNRTQKVKKTKVKIQDNTGNTLTYNLDKFQKISAFDLDYNNGEFDINQLIEQLQEMRPGITIYEVV